MSLTLRPIAMRRWNRQQQQPAMESDGRQGLWALARAGRTRRRPDAGAAMLSRSSTWTRPRCRRLRCDGDGRCRRLRRDGVGRCRPRQRGNRSVSLRFCDACVGRPRGIRNWKATIVSTSSNLDLIFHRMSCKFMKLKPPILLYTKVCFIF